MSSMPQVTAGALTRRDFARRPAWACRRGEPRLEAGRAVVMIPFGFRTGLHSRRARLVDCSRRGVGLVTLHPLLPGDMFMLKAKLRHAVLLMYTVRHCEPLVGEGYRVGGEFSGILGPPDERDPAEVLDALLEADGRERRSAARFG